MINNGWMMHLTEEQLNVIEEMASLFYRLEDIADNLQINSMLLMDMYEQKTEVYTRYKKGYLSADIALRKSIKISAQNGSNPAQVLFNNFKNAL